MASASVSPPVTANAPGLYVTAPVPPNFNASTATAVFITVLRDLIWLLYSILNGQLKIAQLWARILDRPVSQSVSQPVSPQPPVEDALVTKVSPQSHPVSAGSDEKAGITSNSSDVPATTEASDAAGDDDSKDVKKSPKETSPSPSSTNEEVRAWRGSAVRDLCRAIVTHDFDRVYEILKISPRFASSKHPFGWYPIHAASMSGNAELVKFMLDLPGVSVKTCEDSSSGSSDQRSQVRREELHELLGDADMDTWKATALHFACLAGDWGVIKVLIEHGGADFEATDSQGRMPVEYFRLDGGVAEKLEVLKEYEGEYRKWKEVRDRLEPEFKRLCKAVSDENYDEVKKILDKSSSEIVTLTPGGWTLLQQACVRNQPEMVKLLLSYNSTSDFVNDYHHTRSVDRDLFTTGRGNALPVSKSTRPYALHYACMNGNLEIIEMLLKAGARTDYKDDENRTPDAFIVEEATLTEYKRLVEEEKERKAEKERTEKEEKERKEKEEEEKKSKQQSGEGNSGNSSEENKNDEKEDKEDAEKESEEPIVITYESLSIEDSIKTKVIGQRGPIRSVASALRLREHGWVDPERPLVLLFLGSSGVGKTEVAKQVALYLANRDTMKDGAKMKSITEVETEGGFVRLDMSEYQQKHTSANLMGSPKGYVGYDEGGILSGKLEANPKAIVLLDEIEKAHPDVLTVFLQVFDDGRITDPKRGVIYCKDAVFIMTSNLASDEIRHAAPQLRKMVEETENRHEEYSRMISQFNRRIHPILKENLRRDEFLGRINQIVVFLPLSVEEIAIVVNKELDIWKRRAEETHQIRLTWSPTVVTKLGEAYDTHFGARSVKNEVHRVAVQLVADAHIQGKVKAGWLAHLCLNDDGDVELALLDPKELQSVQRGCRLFTVL